MTYRRIANVQKKDWKDSSDGLTAEVNKATWDNIYIDQTLKEADENGKSLRMSRLDSPGQYLQFGIRFTMTDVENKGMIPIVKEVELDHFQVTGYRHYYLLLI